MPQIIQIKPIHELESYSKNLKKVAAYCRVSSSSSAQEESLANQITAYQSIIKTHSEWHFVGIYADDGISGTHRNRNELKRLIEDCKQGKIDILLVKSISRLARNTIECLSIIREIKGYGTRVLIEKENIDTSLSITDFRLSIMGSFAQEESISISRNMKIGVRQRMRRGLWRPSNVTYGYKKSKNELMDIDAETGAIVARIHEVYKNKGLQAIANDLNNENVPCKMGGQSWTANKVRIIIENERYIGDMLLQKKYSPNIFPYELRFNKGDIEKVRYTDSHPALITRERFEINQRIKAYERYVNGVDPKNINYSAKYVFSGKLKCACCGSSYKRRVLRKKKVYWHCTKHMQNKNYCDAKAIPDDILKQTFIHMRNKLRSNCNEILVAIINDCDKLLSHKVMNNDVLKCKQRIEELSEKSLKLSELKNNSSIDYEYYIQEQSILDYEMKTQLKKLTILLSETKCELRIATNDILNEIMKDDDIIEGFNEEVFSKIISKIVIHKDKTVDFHLINKLVLKESYGGNRECNAMYPTDM